ncbi:MAG TPA: Ig-like domain-containing protein [Bacteroidales bacterium]|nr:Ig-like domain-containing protein [Bacteroidales bacterium]
MNSNVIKILLLIFCLIIFTHCANIVAPTGGPKDTEAPIVLKIEPKNNSTNFKNKDIKILFNEFIKLKEGPNNFLSSPPIKSKPELIVKGKNLIIKLKEPLLKNNTTYNISLINAISDITEGNTIPKLNYIFSTGQYIDSMCIIGKVINAFSLEAEAGICVYLYTQNIDSLPLKEQPDYMTISNESGEFIINNIPEGKYKIFALKDLNNNNIYDMPTEKIAYYDTTIHSFYLNNKDSAQTKLFDINKNQIKLFMFNEIDSSQQKLIKCYPLNIGLIKLIFKFPVTNFKFTLIDTNDNQNFIIDPNIKGDTIHIWLSNTDADSLKAIVSYDKSKSDTIQIKLITSQTSKKLGKGTVESNKLTTSLSLSSNNLIDINKPLKILFSKPIKSYNFDKIILTQANDTLHPEINFSDSIKKTIEIKHQWEEDKEYTIFIDSGTFIDIHNYSNDTIKIKFKSKKYTDYGTLIIKIENIPKNSHIILQLLSQNNIIIKEFSVSGPEILTINYLAPGFYKLKAIFDTNKNYKWDTGNYLKKIQAEKVLNYPNNISIKGGWETKIEWNQWE